MTLRNTDTVQQTWCRLLDKSKCCTRQPLRRKKQRELQKQAGWSREQEVALLGRPLSGAPLPCLWHQPPRVCILCILHSGTDIGELGEAEGPKRQMERGHTEGWTGCMRAWWQMLQRVWQLQQQVMMGARDGDGSVVKPPGGLGCSHIRAFLSFLHCRWAGTAAVLSWSWPGVGWGCGCLGFHTAAFLLQSGEQLCPLLPSCFVFYMTGSGPASL